MPEIDLIPAGYREALRLRRWLQRFGLALALVLLTVGGARAAVAWLAAGERPALERLRAGEDASRRQQVELEALQAAAAQSAARADLLTRLREGVPAQRLFTALDRALVEAIRFRELRLDRAVDLPPPPAPGTPVQPGAELAAQVTVTELLTIRGEAGSHAALADFVRALANEPDFVKVRIVSARKAAAETSDAVEFVAEATLHTATRARP